MTKAQGRQHSKNKNYYANGYARTAEHKARRKAARDRKAKSPGHARRRMEREAKHALQYAENLTRIAEANRA